MIVHSVRSRRRLGSLFEALRSHFLLWGHRHGMTGHGTHDRIGPYGAFALVRSHIHTRRHGHGRVVITCCS